MKPKKELLHTDALASSKNLLEIFSVKLLSQVNGCGSDVATDPKVRNLSVRDLQGNITPAIS